MENIETSRLTIRRFEAADRRDFMAYQGHPEVARYMDVVPMDEAQADAFVAKQMALTEGEKGRYHAFAVVHREDARVIGDVGFFLEPGPEAKGDLGFQFHPDYQGKGYAREAAAALIEHGFTVWGLRRITSGCDARNAASYRLMERLGMRREAHFRQSRITRGELHDELAYALLRDEWLAGESTASSSLPD